MGNKELSTIPEKESDEFISPVLRTLSNPRESEDSSGVITFPKDVKIYSNPLLEFDDKYISNDVNPLFDEVLENIEMEILLVKYKGLKTKQKRYALAQLYELLLAGVRGTSYCSNTRLLDRGFWKADVSSYDWWIQLLLAG
ncbi:hypothetical protein Tco_0898390, partial [Tanacetum coccineum]